MIAVEAVDKLLQWAFAQILSFNIISSKVCQVGHS